MSTLPIVWHQEARRLDGLFTGQCEPQEYEYLIEAGLLRQEWDGVAGFLGLSKLRKTGGAQ